ncbi:MAG TPA: phosphate ABC transporter permease subunit PstC [Verrucomicrobiae bacterium]
MSSTPSATGKPHLTWNPSVDLCAHHGEFAANCFHRVSQFISTLVIILLLLIFVFLFKECLPVIWGTVNSSATQPISWAAAKELPPNELAAFLGVTETQLAGFKPEVTQGLVELKDEELSKKTTPESRLNTSSWGLMLFPHQWSGYDRPGYVWQPNSGVPKYNIVPLVLGSLKISLLALLFSVPLAVLAALYVSQLAPRRVREVVKPMVEMLAGIPTVVLGFFGLVILASILQRCFGYEVRLNAFVAGWVTALAVTPIVFTISEDAFSAVPRAHRDTALLLGASHWYASMYVILPAAWPGVAAATLLGFGRAIGETMIALMVSGNAFVMSANLFDSARTIPATIGSELAETAVDSPHYRILFLIGALLFCFSFLMNLLGERIISRVKKHLEGSVAEPQVISGMPFVN